MVLQKEKKGLKTKNQQTSIARHYYFLFEEEKTSQMRAFRKHLQISIYNTNDPFLQSATHPIPISSPPKNIINDINILTEVASHHKLVSLSANQIRMDLRMFAILKEQFIIPGQWKSYERTPNDYEVIINPELVKDGGLKFKDFQECPSVPGMKFAIWNPIKQVYHFQRPLIKAKQIVFKSDQRTLNGFKARLWDHQVRHLNGLLPFAQNISHGQVFVNDQFRQNPGMHEMVECMKSDLKFMSREVLQKFFEEGVKEQQRKNDKGLGVGAQNLPEQITKDLKNKLGKQYQLFKKSLEKEKKKEG